MADRLEEIFEEQKKIMDRFRPIQLMNHCIPGDPLPLDPETRTGSIELHLDLHWINIELQEVISSYVPEDRREEISDVVHFMADFCILAGVTPTEIVPEPHETYDRLDILLAASEGDAFVFDDAETNARFCILAVLRLADILKNKPWKQTLRPIDRTEFIRRIASMWYWLGAVARTAGMNSEDLYKAYFDKAAENHNRIDTGV